MSLRIAAGKHRGRALAAGPDKAIRPSAAQTRARLFNILAHGGEYRTATGQMPQGARVLDVFAGSGALGLEALSRGAAHAAFIDNDAAAAQFIRQNIASLGESQRCTVYCRDALEAAAIAPPPAPFDLVLLDPPYRKGLAAPALAALAKAGWLAAGAVAAVEVAARENFAPPADFTLLDERASGAGKLVFLRYRT
jgi:16S rRNA (guanine966-N2)-methyltransferase